MHIKYVGITYLKEFSDHLKGLSTDDKYTRFCYNVTDAQIDRLILSIVYAPDINHLFVAEENGKVMGFVHLGKESADSWELALSVDKEAQGKGLGNKLIEYAVKWAKMEGIKSIVMHCINENKKIQHLARKNNLKVISRDGNDITAEVKIPEPSIIDYSSNYIDKQTKILTEIINLRLKLFNTVPLYENLTFKN